MIVVGSERHGARRRISPGSTGERLLHGAICPVAIAPRGFREHDWDTPVKRIGVSFVDTPEAHEALRFAADLAKDTAASLVALHRGRAARRGVLADHRARRRGGVPGHGPRGRRAPPWTARWRHCPRASTATEELLEGDTVDALAALDEHEIDLLVCGSRGYGPVRRVLLGGVLRTLVRRAACPVVSCREGRAA